MPLDNNLKKLQTLLATLEEDNLTKSDFADAFADVVNLIKKIEEKNVKEFEAMKKLVDDLTVHLKGKTDKGMTEMSKKSMDYCMAEMQKMMKTHEQKMGEVDSKMDEVKDGKDADELLIAQKASDLAIVEVLKQLPKIADLMNELPKAGVNIASALELLPDGEKLKIEAIEGLKELLEEVKNRRALGGGGFSKMAMDSKIIDPYTPTGDINGVNTDFVLTNIPNPTASLKVYKDGQKMKLATDYTLSGRTITFLSAPLADTIFEAEHRI